MEAQQASRLEERDTDDDEEDRRGVVPEGLRSKTFPPRRAREDRFPRPRVLGGDPRIHVGDGSRNRGSRRVSRGRENRVWRSE